VAKPQAAASPEYYVHTYGKLGASVICHCGFDNLYTSAWYVLLLALLPLSVIVYARHIWRLACESFSGPRLDVLQCRLQADRSASVEGTVQSDFQSIQTTLAACLRKRWYRVKATEGSNKVYWLVGQKWCYAAFGVVLIHISVLVIAGGAILGQWPGLAVNKMITITEGSTYQDPDGDLNFVLKLNNFAIEYYPDGSTAKAYKSDLSILNQRQEIKRKTVMANQPLSYNHFNLFQYGWGLASFTLKVASTNGKVEMVKFPLVEVMGDEQRHTRYYQVPLQESEVFIEDGQRAIIATAFVPDAWEQDAEIVGSQSEFPKDPAVKLTVATRFITRGLDLTDLGWIKYGQPATYNGGTIQLADVQYYSIIAVRRDYGLPLVWLGFVTLFIGLVITLYLKPHTIVASLTDTGEQVRVALSAFRGTNYAAEVRMEQRPVVLQDIINSINARVAEPCVNADKTKSNEAKSAIREKTSEGQRDTGNFWENNLPSLDVLDQTTYQIIALAFPLLTLVIITGAAWAQAAWTRWWSWDPKETAALVTWLIYSAYLHGRFRKGWRGGPAAAFAIFGFATVLFCFVGPSLIPGLHSHSGRLVGEGGRIVLTGFQGISPAEIWLTQGFIWMYVLAMLTYFGFAITRNFVIGKATTILAWIGLLTLTAMLVLRACEAGRLPWTSSYDFALCFIWVMSIAYLIAEQLLGTKVLGVFVLPIVLALALYAYLLLPAQGSMPLVPALQNRLWLHFHVPMAILAFGTLALSCASGLMYFVKRKVLAAAARGQLDSAT